MKAQNFKLKAMVIAIIAVMFSANVQAGMYNRRQAKSTIEQTSYIISEAYEICEYYEYWQTNNLSKAMYYNDYAQNLYFYHRYRNAINYSLLAREYALEVIDGCDDYWEFFYYTYFGWSNRYGYNYNFAYSNGYRDGYYDGYYARYCNRYSHDYRRDPHHSMHSDWYREERYNDVMNGNYFNRNNSSVAIGRGNSGRSGRTNGTLSSGGGNTGYFGNGAYSGSKNLVSSDYFSTKEQSMLNSLPPVSNLEKEFNSNNPTANFSDASLSSNTSLVKRNKESASAFSSVKSNIDIKNKIETPKPTTMLMRDGTTISGKTTRTKNINSLNTSLSKDDYREIKREENNSTQNNNRITNNEDKPNSSNVNSNRTIIINKDNDIRRNNTTNMNSNNSNRDVNRTNWNSENSNGNNYKEINPNINRSSKTSSTVNSSSNRSIGTNRNIQQRSKSTNDNNNIRNNGSSSSSHSTNSIRSSSGSRTLSNGTRNSSRNRLSR